MVDVTISGASGTLRTIHMTFAYWGFVLMSFHLGLHIRAVSAPFTKKMNKTVRTLLAIIFLIISAYGVYAFVKRGIGDYLLMKAMFAFLDFGEQKVKMFYFILQPILIYNFILIAAAVIPAVALMIKVYILVNRDSEIDRYID